MKYKKYFLIFLVFVASIRILYIWNGPFGLTPDEAHYWEWSRRLDLSYYSKGPAVAYIIAFFTAIFGDTEFGVRIGAVLASLVGSALLFVITRDVFKSDRAAFFSALLPNFTPLYSVGSVLMTTDAPFIMAWGLCVYLLRNAVKEESWTYWYMAGLIAGIGLLSKYTMAMIFPCFLLYLVFVKRDRHWLLRKEPYIALIISLIIFSPVIFWNMKYDWVTIKHT
ncbi:MAG: glycosyltransferase family 39 protein, partial [Thermodesulfobacteriota bacterium]